MKRALSVRVEGLGVWATGLPDWTACRGWLRGEADPDPEAPARPRPARLSAGERRRASLHVLAAIEVADQAVRMSGRDAATLPCVFTSAHGDAGIMDYMCAILADTPQHLSPTRFHNSVHNAAVGYWTIATGCQAPSNAVAAMDASFGAGLLEAATQACVENVPVLLVAHDAPGSGPLGTLLGTREVFACALVLSPAPRRDDTPGLDIAIAGDETPGDAPALPAGWPAGNPTARGLTLLRALAGERPATLAVPASDGTVLDVQVDPTRRSG